MALKPCEKSSLEPVSGEISEPSIVANMDAELKELEAELERLAPEALPEGLITRMAAAMDGWQESEHEEKVVPFPQGEAKTAAGRNGFWRAAAAVAILGAAAALLVPQTSPVDGGSPVALASFAPSGAASTKPVGASFAPVSAERNVVNAENHGPVVLVGGVPHRCVRVDSFDLIEYVDESGAQILVKKPSVDFMLIPLQPD